MERKKGFETLYFQPVPELNDPKVSVRGLISEPVVADTIKPNHV
jgi:hypothetical protein